MDISPFAHQGPLRPDDLRARRSLVDDLVERVTARRVTALLGPRRYGKTSALRLVQEQLVEVGATVVWLDLYELTSWADLASRLDTALVRASGSGRTSIAELSAAVQLRLGVVGLDLRKPERERPDPVLVARDQLQVIVRTAQRTPTLFVVDEFSGIARVDGAAGMLRTELQHHFQDVGLLFAGSEPSTMRMLFGEQTQPFYGQADIVVVEPLSDLEVTDVVSSGFERSGMPAGSLPARITAFTGGHPQRTMQLADACWQERARDQGDDDDDVFAAALATVRGSTSSGFERLFSSFGKGEKTVLRIIADGGSIFGTAARFFDIAPGAAQHARRSLLDAGHLHDHDGRLELVDPVLADWIRTRFG